MEGDKSSNSSALIMISLLLMIGVYTLWTKFGYILVNTLALLSVYLVTLANNISELIPISGTSRWFFNIFVDQYFIDERYLITSSLNQIDIYKPKFKDAKLVLYIIGYFLRFPLLIIGLFLTRKVFERSKPSRLNRTFNLITLAKYSIPSFPQIRPALIANLLDLPFDKGPYRREATPIRFAILHNALSVTDGGETYLVQFAKKHAINEKKRIFYITDNFDIDEGLPVIHSRCLVNIKKIRYEFQNQITALGRWSGSNDLTDSTKALYAVFLLNIKAGEVNKKKAKDLLNQFNLTFKSTPTHIKNLSFDMSGVEEVIEEYENQPAVQKILKSYTYVSTVLVALFDRGTNRKAKLPPNLFTWLKEVDRGLWYALHQNLSPSAWTEGGGPRGIFLTEKKLERKANYPFTDNSITGFLKYLNFEGWLTVSSEGYEDDKGQPVFKEEVLG
jgi:hypothetical protein